MGVQKANKRCSPFQMFLEQLFNFKDLCKEGISQEAIEEKIQRAQRLLEDIPDLDIGRLDHRAVHGVLESLAVTLWNHVVALKTRGGISSKHHADLRHMSCLLELRCNGSSQNELALKKILMMTLKTGRIWLDCGNAEKANTVLSLSSKCIDKIQNAIITRKNNGEAVEKDRLELERDLFQSLCYRAEAAVVQGNYQAAMQFIVTAKEIISVIPKEGGFLSMLCYNFGVEAYQRQNFEESASFLRESFEIGKNRPGISLQNQGRTLRLLANVYLGWDGQAHLQKAANAVTLANSVHPHQAGLFLDLKVILLSKETKERVKAAVDEIIKHPNTTLQLGLNTVAALRKYERTETAMWVLEQLRTRFEKGSGLGVVHTLQLELLLQDTKEEEARAYAEQIITEHCLQHILDAETQKRFHVLFWERAAQLFNDNCFPDAVEWYNFSLSLFSPDLHGNHLAKLHRNRSTCYLNMDQMAKAKEAAEEAIKADGQSPFNQFLCFKVAIAQGDAERAQEALRNMSEKLKMVQENEMSVKEQQSLICLAAHVAFESKKQDIAVTALECLLERDRETVSTLTATRCLIRLYISEVSGQEDPRENKLKVLKSLQSALTLLRGFKGRADCEVDVERETLWFMKIAWNIALQCEDCPEDMKSFFKLCQQFTSLSSDSLANFGRQKACLMMVVAAGLELARKNHDVQDKKEILQDALLQLGDCRRICQKIYSQQMSTANADLKKDSSEILMLLYEFEARTKLGDPDVESVLEKALAMPCSQAKTYETIAALAMESPSQYRKISIRALKAAVRKHLQSESIDVPKLSKAFHSLIQLSLDSGDVSDRGCGEEAFTYYTEILQVFQKISKRTYPEMEALWLMTKAWNKGIYIFNAGAYKDAEKWCGMSLQFLEHLPTMRQTYEEQMNSVYSDILTKLETKGAENMEE